MRPSHYEQLYGKRRWIYLSLLIALALSSAVLWTQGVDLWKKQLASLRTPSALQTEAPASAGDSSQKVSLTVLPPQPKSPQDVQALEPAPGGNLVPKTKDDLMVRVRHGNCLWRLAERHCGTGFRWPEIYEANRPPIVDPDLIHPGQSFRIPCGK